MEQANETRSNQGYQVTPVEPSQSDDLPERKLRDRMNIPEARQVGRDVNWASALTGQMRQLGESVNWAAA